MQQGHTCLSLSSPCQSTAATQPGRDPPWPLLPDSTLILLLPDTTQERRSRPGAKHGHASPNTGSEGGIPS